MSEEIITLSSEDEDKKKSEEVRRSAKKKTKIKVWRKDGKQPTLVNYFRRTGGDYFTVHKQSSLPAQPLEDLTQFLQVNLKEEGETLNESDFKLNEGVQLECITNQIQHTSSASSILEDLLKRIDAPFEYDVQELNLDRNLVAVLSESEDNENIEVTTSNKKTKKKIICPKYKVVEGSLFAVDAFRYGDISYVEHYFLTHFHADHYIGLRKKFKHKIYLSQITAVLVSQFIGVAQELLIVVHVNMPFYIGNCKITPMDANHCPGALLFLFQFPDGRNVLHTGDFRGNNSMVELLNKWNCKLDLVYLDTTYLSSKRRMPAQSESIEFLIENVQTYLEQNIGEKFLIIVGAYLIGKEKIWISIVKHFNFKAYLEKERLKAFKAICSCSAENLEIYKKYVTENEDEADIRVVNMIQLSYPNLRDFLRDNQDSFNTILGVIASGWENQKYSPGRISLLHVQYSEHSSYDELETFISATKPKSVISTVPVRINSATTAEIPQDWTSDNAKPRRKMKQKSINERNKNL